MRRDGAWRLLVLAALVAGCKVERPPNAEFQSFVDQADVTAVVADTAGAGDDADAAEAADTDQTAEAGDTSVAAETAETADTAETAETADTGDAGDAVTADVQDAGQDLCLDPVACDDGNLCTDDSCNPASGCVFAASAKPCDDGNACTTVDACAGKACVPGASAKCDDGNLCTDDSCNSASGCVFVANAKPCDDGQACTTDTCEPGSGCKSVATTQLCTAGKCQCGTIGAECKVSADCAAPVCGDGKCDGNETAPNCPKDCGFLANPLGGACTTPGSKGACGDGYFCTARSAQGGGHVCAADFETWGVLADARPASDFQDASDHVKDTKTGFFWAKESLGPMNWTAALTACTTKAYGGFQDWRLPTRAVLRSLVDFTKQQPAASAPTLAWPTDQGFYWSTVPWVAGGSAWGVHFEDGSSGKGGLSSSYRVRCVRSPSTAGLGKGGRYAVQDAGKTVLDRATGLRWQQGYSATKLNWSDAKGWCANNTPALPATGWRLPTVRELATLVDSQTQQPAIDAVFAGTPNEGFWSSTPWVAGGSAWGVYFDDGYSGYDVVSGTVRVRCVR